MKVLVLTVGGKPGPVKHAIEQMEPDYLVFICSSGPTGSVKSAEELVGYFGFEESIYRIFTTENPDSLDAVYAAVDEAHRELSEHLEKPIFIANYTGGTKSMSAGLVLFALANGWELQLQEGARNDLDHVKNNDISQTISLELVRAELARQGAKRMANRADFEGAASYLHSEIRELKTTQLREGLRKDLTLYQFQAALDRFDLEEARRTIEYLDAESREEWRAPIGKALRTVEILQSATPSTDWQRDHHQLSFSPVHIMLKGVHASIQRRRYDEAFARLYRATELIAQIRLYKHFGILTGAPDPSKLPESLQEEAPLTLGLQRAYQCLSDLGDQIGKDFMDNLVWIQNALKFRNNSIMAHGFHPSSLDDWKKHGAQLLSFLEEVLTESQREKR